MMGSRSLRPLAHARRHNSHAGRHTCTAPPEQVCKRGVHQAERTCAIWAGERQSERQSEREMVT